MNVKELGILLLSHPVILMFRLTNAARRVHNRLDEDGRMNVVEPRAREGSSQGKLKVATLKN